MKSKIYTATGDAGSTSLVGGKRVKKTDIRLEAYGTVDELNAFIGNLAISAKMEYPDMYHLLRVIQCKLFNIGAYLATDNPRNDTTSAQGLSIHDVIRVEQAIDLLDNELPPLNNFILPGGSPLSSKAQICRTVARRCERRILTLCDTAYIDPIILKYINRLSDFFFVFARFNNLHNQIEDIL